jgi:prepilin-type N-terminal cleavage/methylation domain-containing protein
MLKHRCKLKLAGRGVTGFTLVELLVVSTIFGISRHRVSGYISENMRVW